MGTLFTALALFISSGTALSSTSEDVTIPSPDPEVRFAGRLLHPGGDAPVPAALLIAPAGHPGDEIKRGSMHLARLAEALARNGIASLRVDARGLGDTESPAADAYPAQTSAQLADDASCWLDWLRARADVDTDAVGLVAHGDACLIATLLAARDRRCAYIALLAPPGIPGVDQLVDRMLGVDREGEVVAKAEALSASLKLLAAQADEQEVQASVEETMRLLGVPEEAAAAGAQQFRADNDNPWTRHYLSFDPAQAMTRVSIPVLFLSGADDDRHRPAQNLAPLEAAVRGSGNFSWERVELPELGHFLSAPDTEPEEFHPAVMRLVPNFIINMVGLTAPEHLMPPPADAPREVVFAHVHVVDVRAGRVLPGCHVHVANGRIESISDAPPEASGAIRVDGRDQYLIPGLCDMHGHLSFYGLDALPRMATYGVLTYRDMGGHLGRLEQAREDVRAGRLLGPELVMAGPFVDGKKPNYRWRRFVTDAADGAAVVDELEGAGVDFLKVHSRTPREAYLALAARATELGIPFAGHVPLGMTPREVADAGQASIEHTDSLISSMARAPGSGVTSWTEARDFWQSPDGEAELAHLVAQGTYVTPTLVAGDTLLAKMQPGITGLLPWFQDLTGRLHRAGVPLLTGTDFGRRLNGIEPGAALHRELELLVEAGLSHAEALRAATLRPAQFLDREGRVGEVAPGQRADLVLLAADPLDDITATRKIRGVMVQGRWITQPQLIQLRQEATP